ncbi:hypothetical protein BRADI_1g56922v3 [Brachypodium distachyon]|uniref:GTD-binding domain-containing protein n=1 Tax=Brachypodium distachyon TaxID=15368 RepID=A0A0Q3JT48_BRADI|nr:hypothetical protein BRADI_1g56922v3 [Brachypodium distachyon]
MDPMATTWSRSVRRRAPASEQDEAERRELIQKAEELEEAVEALRAERDAAAEEEAALRAELEAERGAAESAASEAMRMIERLQRETAALLLEARQLRRLAESRAGRDRELESRLASLSALARGYLSLLRAHGIDPDAEEDDQQERPPVAGEEFEDTGRVVAMAAAAEEEREQDRVAVDAAAEDLCARLEALEADSTAERREVAALRAERARVVLAREMARRLRQEAAAVAERPPDAAVRAAHKPRFCVLAVCKVLCLLRYRLRAAVEFSD